MIRKLSLAFLILITSLTIKPQEPIPLDDFDITGMTLMFPDSQVRTQNIKNKIRLFCDDEGFLVQKDNNLKRVHSHDTDKLFRKADLKQIAKYGCLNKFKVSKFNNGEYAIHAHGELKGGGPITGAILYWLTKSTCYGVAGAGVAAAGTAAGVAIVGTGGAAGIAGMGAAAGVAGSAIGGVGAGAVAGAIGTSAAASSAAMTATIGAGVATGGSVAGVIIAIESASNAAFLAGLALPLP